MTCEHKNSDIVESRPTNCVKSLPVTFPQAVRRRRRKCFDCGELFTTYEVTDEDLRAVVQQLVGDSNRELMLLRNALGHIQDTIQKTSVS